MVYNYSGHHLYDGIYNVGHSKDDTRYYYSFLQLYDLSLSLASCYNFKWEEFLHIQRKHVNFLFQCVTLDHYYMLFRVHNEQNVVNFLHTASDSCSLREHPL